MKASGIEGVGGVALRLRVWWKSVEGAWAPVCAVFSKFSPGVWPTAWEQSSTLRIYGAGMI